MFCGHPFTLPFMRPPAYSNYQKTQEPFLGKQSRTQKQNSRGRLCSEFYFPHQLLRSSWAYEGKAWQRGHEQGFQTSLGQGQWQKFLFEVLEKSISIVTGFLWPPEPQCCVNEIPIIIWILCVGVFHSRQLWIYNGLVQVEDAGKRISKADSALSSLCCNATLGGHAAVHLVFWSAAQSLAADTKQLPVWGLLCHSRQVFWFLIVPQWKKPKQN